MRPRPEAFQLFPLLGGAAILAALAIGRLPRYPDLLQPPLTPFDRSASPSSAESYRLFRAAAALIPQGATVATLSQPRDAKRETALHREAVALLPGRRVVPAALWDIPTGREGEADFLIVVGAVPTPAPGTLLLKMPRGSVWRRVRT
jgi:hypothetical protein